MDLRFLIFLALFFMNAQSQSFDQIKLDIKKDFDGILQEKNKETKVISDKIKQFVVPYLMQYNRISSFVTSCPMTSESQAIRSLISSAVCEFKGFFQNDLINDILSDVIVSIGAIQEFINQVKIDNTKNDKCFTMHKPKFSIIFSEFIDSVKDSSINHLASMRGNFVEIGHEIEAFLNEIIADETSKCDHWNSYVIINCYFIFTSSESEI